MKIIRLVLYNVMRFPTFAPDDARSASGRLRVRRIFYLRPQRAVLQSNKISIYISTNLNNSGQMALGNLPHSGLGKPRRLQ